MLSNLRSPIYVQVELTSDCNNHCLHCYNFWKYEKSTERRRSLSIEELRKIAEILGKNDIFYVTVTGGEPFLEKEKLYRFLDFLIEKNIRIMINSNATLITENDVKKLREYPIEIFLVSLLSHNSQTHNKIAGINSSFESTLQGINLLQKYGINIAVNMVSMKLNYKDVYSTGKWLNDQLGIKNFSATPICPSSEDHQWLELERKEVLDVLTQLIELRNELGTRIDILEVLPTCLFTEDATKEIIKIFSKRMCTAGNTTITIGSEGDVRVCSFDNQSYGNILEENFNDIWNKMGHWRNDSLLPTECKTCVIVDSCGGGCRVNSKIKKGVYCELDSLSKGTLKENQDIFFSEISDIDIDSNFSCLKNILFRKEKENIYLIVANSMYFVLLNAAGLKLLKHLINLDTFIPKEVIKSFNLDYDDGKKLFAELLSKGFLREIGNNKKGGEKKWLWNYQK